MREKGVVLCDPDPVRLSVRHQPRLQRLSQQRVLVPGNAEMLIHLTYIQHTYTHALVLSRVLLSIEPGESPR